MSEKSWREKFSPVERETSLEDYRGRKGSIWVVAPHPDEDVLGVGGTIAAPPTKGRGFFQFVLLTAGVAPERIKVFRTTKWRTLDIKKRSLP